jgi:hypothetical protein
MIASLGFISAALLFSIFAYSVGAVSNTGKIKAGSLMGSYNLLTLACVSWAVGAYLGSDQALKTAVIVGSALLAGATVLLVRSVIPPKWSIVAIVATGIAGALYVAIRIFAIKPEPYMQEGILIFNTQKSVGYALIAAFVLIWLPAMMRYVRNITESNGIGFLTSTGIFASVVATLGVVCFLSAAELSKVIVSFVVLCCAYIPLIFINFLAARQN